jgi:hypothetical protein
VARGGGFRSRFSRPRLTSTAGGWHPPSVCFKYAEKEMRKKGTAVQERLAKLEQAAPLSSLLGWLNFSDGRPDPRWQKQLNDAYALLAGHGESAPWQSLLDALTARLHELHATAPAFRDVRQAERALALTIKVLPAYRTHHADLLAHLDDRDLFTPFFLARVFEAVLALGIFTEDDERAVADVLSRLNDFVGYRPIAVLETRPQGEPYDHERHRPVPLYIRGAGTAFGRYYDLSSTALAILKETDPGLLADAQFDPELLDEFALDMRAYDHGHPVNRRPNYIFGEWDPHHIDNQGRYRRYVVRKIALDALLDRVDQPGPLDRGERLWEAAAVLAGTVLMASGVSGAGPSAHDSTTTLGVLLPRIAQYRDAFYGQLLAKRGGAHAERLRQEQASMRQPFGGARRHLNNYLARHRAAQLQQRYLALIYAQMGYPEASREEAKRIPAVSVRMLSEVLNRLTSGQLEAEHGELTRAAARLAEVEDHLRRGVSCGAFADPWNLLGFQALFPLSAAREDSVRDQRLDELVQVVEQIFNLYSRLSSEAAAAGDEALAGSLAEGMDRLAAWWDPFATVEVSEVRRVHGGEAAASARHVAAALSGWRQRGEAAADLAFWRGQIDSFSSSKSFYLVVDALLRKGDFRASLALLASWLGRAEQVPLEDGAYSFHGLALRWLLALTQPAESEGASMPPTSERAGLVVKFFDYLEANAEEYWEVPDLDVEELEADEEEDDDDLYGAAYDEMTFQDSTDDADGAVSDGGEPTDEFDLEREGERLDGRLRFLMTLARLWQVAARFLATAKTQDSPLPEWLRTAREKRRQMLTLLDAVHDQSLPEPTGDYDSLVEYDRRRVLREQVLYTTIAACLDMTLAVGALQGAVGADDAPEMENGGSPAWEADALRLEAALFHGEPDAARAALPSFLERFQQESLLSPSLTEGGRPRQILQVRVAQTVLRALLANLPRLGLVRETFDLLRAARVMEQAHPPRGRGVTEFNHFFQAAYQAVVESVVDSSAGWPADQAGDGELVAVLERLTAPFLALWVEHSRTLQLSVLETLANDADWHGLQTFVQRYGGDLFHSRFMTLANLRGVLHRGVGAYLDYLGDNPDPLHPVRLLDDLGRLVSREKAVRFLELTLQAVVENYEEYKDYNTTTAQSDYGENLHVLLEFLRLKALYERHSWQFRPFVLAHEVLARRGRDGAAIRWEHSVARFTQERAARHLEQLTRLEQARGVHLGTVADRLNERFVQPLALDRLCALIEPAMDEARRDGDRPAFPRVRKEVEAFTATPAGVGLDVPAWLRRLEMEVHRVQAAHTTMAALAEGFFRIPRRPLTYEELQQQLREWERPALPE